MRAHLLLGAAIGSTYVLEDADAQRRAWERALQAARANDDADLLTQVLERFGAVSDACRQAHRCARAAP